MNIKCKVDESVLILGIISVNDDRNRNFQINDQVSMETIRASNQFYTAEEIKRNERYVINRRHKAWVMNDRIYKNGPLYSFFSYLFVESELKENYRCVAFTKSPAFRIMSSRRFRSNENDFSKLELYRNEIIPFEDENENRLENEEVKEILNAAKDKNNSFKYSLMMPHIFDDEDENEQPDSADKEKRIKQRDISSIESMDEIYNDMMNDEANTIYKLSLPNNSYMEMRLSEVKISDKPRDELSYSGKNFRDAKKYMESGLIYLDSFGNKFKIVPPNVVTKIN